MKKLFLIVNCLLVLSNSPVWARAEDPTAITVRIRESIGTVTMTVARGSATPEELTFRTSKGQTPSEMFAVQYQKLLTELYQQGYVLQGVIPGRHDEDISYSTLLFAKNTKP